MFSLKRIIIIALALTLFAITLGYYRLELDKISRIREAITKSEIELEEKRQAVREYREKVAFYKTDEGAEHLAREQYNLVQEGERVILLKSSDVDYEERTVDDIEKEQKNISE